MTHFIEPRMRKYNKDMDFYLEIYLTNAENNYWIQEKMLPESNS